MLTHTTAQSSARHSICVTIPNFAVLSVQPDNAPINLQLNAPSESGEGVTFDNADGSKWLNYTSALSGGSRSIAAQISSGGLPSGLDIYLEVGGYAGGGSGGMGNSTGLVNLSSTPQTIITNIGRGYTGTGSGNGHQLTYSLSISDYGELDADGGSTVSVIFTITE